MGSGRAVKLLTELHEESKSFMHEKKFFFIFFFFFAEVNEREICMEKKRGKGK